MSEIPKKSKTSSKTDPETSVSPTYRSKPVIEPAETRPVRVERVFTSSFEGPLPPPHILEAYNRIVPNGAERIFAVFEKQVDHRQQLERTVISTNAALQVRGFYAALFIALLTIAAGVWLAFLGKSVIGVATIISALGSLLTVFIYERRKQDTERTQKKQNTQPR